VAGKLTNIQFNATKQTHFYGLKFHAIVNQTGFIPNFILTSSSFHDAKIGEALLCDFHALTLIGDAEYIG
jgi:hypothetical protein